MDADGKKNISLNYCEDTVPGKYIVFPSNMWHYAMINTSYKPRITIAANIFPSGEISDGGVGHLNIKVT